MQLLGRLRGRRSLGRVQGVRRRPCLDLGLRVLPLELFRSDMAVDEQDFVFAWHVEPTRL